MDEQGRLDIDELYDVVVEFFGSKLTMPLQYTADKTMTCILYESFMFSFGVAGRYGTFTGGYLYDGKTALREFLGQRLSIDADRDGVLRNLELVDEWCRLRLPDKFLDALDAPLASVSE